MTTYKHRAWEVDVVGWTGKNFDEVKEFVEKHFGNEVDARHYTHRGLAGENGGPAFEFSTRDRTWTIRTGSVLVIHRDKDLHRKIEILPITVFKRAYEKA